MLTVSGCLLPAAGISCSHGEPFTPPGHAASQPLNVATFPVRLTYNRGADRDVSWLGNSGGFFYSFHRLGYREGDTCLGQMPATGGRLVHTLCADSHSSLDSIDTYSSPARGPDSLLAFMRWSALPGQLGPALQELMVVLAERPDAVLVRMPVPYTIPLQPTHSGVSQLRWLDSRTLVYRAEMLGFPQFQLVRSGLAIVMIELSDTRYSRTVIPGTRYASSVAVLGEDEVVYTRGGESVVYAWSRSRDTTRVVWDFGGGIARGVTIGGNRLVAVVGGLASFGFDDAFQDSVLSDNGGTLHIVDLATGDDGVIDQFSFYRFPALSPDGRTLIVESPVRTPDLFRFELP